MYNGNSKYIRFGPNDDLEVLGMLIDTNTKYIYFQILMLIVEVINCFVKEIGDPILGFSVYNPDKKYITDFTKNELQFFANTFWFVGSIRRALMVVVSISQIDIAILRVCYSEITTIFTIRMLLNEKVFGEDPNTETHNDANQVVEQTDDETLNEETEPFLDNMV